MLHRVLIAGYRSTSGSLADPSGSNVVVTAISWLQATLLGSLATTIAVIAIATVGLMMLAGRVSIRYGFTVIVGSFILFGASTIVSGVQSSLAGHSNEARYVPPARTPPAPPPMTHPRANNDPYAGASVPTR